jgi:hypothetical protein
MSQSSNSKPSTTPDTKKSYLLVINSPKKFENYSKIILPKLNLDKNIKKRNQKEFFKKRFKLSPLNYKSEDSSQQLSKSLKESFSSLEKNLNNINNFTPDKNIIKNKSNIPNHIVKLDLLPKKYAKRNNSSLHMNNLDDFIPNDIYKNNENRNKLLQRNNSVKSLTKRINSKIKLNNNININKSCFSPIPHSMHKNINFIFKFPKEKITSPIHFHRRLMSKNIDSYNLSKLNDYIKYSDKENKKIQEKLNEKITTGIYGPNNNLLSIILARMERLKINHEFKEMVSDPDIQKILQDEFMLGQVRLKRKPKKIVIGKNNEIKSLCMQKLEKYNYLSSQNKIMYVNPIGNLPKMIEDNEIMYKYYDDAYNIFKEKKYKINLKKIQ